MVPQQRSNCRLVLRELLPYILTLSAALALMITLQSTAGSQNSDQAPIDRYPVSLQGALRQKTQAAPPLTALCNSVNTSKEYVKEDLSCDKIGHIIASYNIRKSSLGVGAQADGRLLTDKKTGTKFITRLLHENGEEEQRQTLEAINFGRKICGRPNMMQLADVKCFKDNVAPIWTRCEGIPLSQYFRAHDDESKCLTPNLSLREIQNIIRQLVDIINHLMDILTIHGDLYYQNILYDRLHGSICLIDYDSLQSISSKVTLQTKEARFEVERKQQRTVGKVIKDDMLAVGVMLGGLIGIPRFQINTYWNMPEYWTWRNLINLLGATDYLRHTKLYSVDIPEINSTVLRSVNQQRADWSEYINDCNRHLATPEAVDFYDKIMRYSFMERYEFFKHAGSHPFLNLKLASS